MLRILSEAGCGSHFVLRALPKCRRLKSPLAQESQKRKGKENNVRTVGEQGDTRELRLKEAV